MQLSLEKLSPEISNTEEISEIFLSKKLLRLQDGREIAVEPEEVWPPFSFLRGIGVSSIRFHSHHPTAVEAWSKRMAEYQQEFLQDPDYLDWEDSSWHERDFKTQGFVIECVLGESYRKQKARTLSPLSVPPMRAPLGVSPENVRAFVSEIRNQKPQDTLRRIRLILKEFKNAKPHYDQKSFNSLIANLISVALENKHLRDATEIALEHNEELSSIWTDEALTLRILSSLEPKHSEVEEWAQIFSSLSTEKLVEFLKTHLNSTAGPQIIRLMNHRAESQSSKLVKVCFEQEPPVQKILLQWLSPHWRPQHYDSVRQALHNAILRRDDIDLISYWIQALLKSYRIQAFEDLKKYFIRESNGFWPFRKKTSMEREQRLLVRALAAQPSAEMFRFFEELRPQVSGGTADEVEKILTTFQSKRGQS